MTVSKLHKSWSLPIFKRTVKRVTRITRRLSNSQLQRFQELAQEYDLTGWENCCTQREFVANLYLLDVLDRIIFDRLTCRSALDVGSSRWWYLPALKAFMPLAWTGVELPARQRGRRFDMTRSHARYFCKNYVDCEYLSCCVTEIKRRFDFITWFLPYVAINPLLASGLHEQFFDPAGLLRQVWNRLEPCGLLLIVNQGEAEVELQQKYLDFERLDAQFVGSLDSVFNPFHYPRFGWILRKDLRGNSRPI